jgi:hypothetical protein
MKAPLRTAKKVTAGDGLGSTDPLNIPDRLFGERTMEKGEIAGLRVDMRDKLTHLGQGRAGPVP